MKRWVVTLVLSISLSTTGFTQDADENQLLTQGQLVFAPDTDSVVLKSAPSVT